MSTVTITKTQYDTLKQRADAYERLVSAANDEASRVPPIKSAKKIVAAMRSTKRYPDAFLKSVEKGLARSKFLTK